MNCVTNTITDVGNQATTFFPRKIAKRVSFVALLRNVDEPINKIVDIKALRAEFGIGLKEAKDFRDGNTILSGVFDDLDTACAYASRVNANLEKVSNGSWSTATCCASNIRLMITNIQDVEV